METSRHVETAAEAIAAGQIARCGWDVSVQYGAHQPEYDLVAVRGDLMVKISVKGSNTGKWGLSQKFLEGADYHRAVDQWLAKHTRKTVFLLVQFRGVALAELPRLYLATPQEIGRRLKETAGGRGATILYEDHTWGVRAQAADQREILPEGWRFSAERLTSLAIGIDIEGLPDTAKLDSIPDTVPLNT